MLTIVVKPVIAARVVCLFSFCGPMAILRRVGAIVVNAVDTMMLGRKRSQISKESGEGFSPSIADGDTARPIVDVGFLGRIVTTSKHTFPYGKFGRVAAAVLCQSLGGNLKLQAPTRLRISTAQVARRADDGIAAIAATLPKHICRLVCIRWLGFLEDSQAVEPLTSQVNEVVAVLRGIMRLHQNHLSGVKPWGVSAPPGQLFAYLHYTTDEGI